MTDIHDFNKYLLRQNNFFFKHVDLHYEQIDPYLTELAKPLQNMMYCLESHGMFKNYRSLVYK